MTRPDHHKTSFLLRAAAIAVIAIETTAAAQPASSDPLQIVPADALFCVRINKLDATLGQMDLFLAGVSPVPLSMPVKSQLAQMLGSFEPAGINMNGDFAVFGPLPGGDGPDPTRIGILVPVIDYQKFATGNPKVTPPDARGVSRIGPQDAQIFAAVNVGAYALVTPMNAQQALTDVKNWMPRGTASLAQRLGAEELKRAQGSPVWAYGNIQTLSKMFGPMIQAKMEQAKEGLEQMQGRPMMGQPGAMGDMLSTMVHTVLQETQSASLSLTPTNDAIRLGFAMNAVPDTGVAKFFTGTSPAPDKAFLRYLDNGAAMNLVTTIDSASLTRINDLSLDMLAKMVGKDASSQEVQALRKMATDAVSALGGSLAISVTTNPKSKPAFEASYVIGVRDPQVLNRLLDEAPKLLNTGLVAELNKTSGVKFGFELQRKSATYKDVQIDAFKVTFTPADANSQAVQMVAAMYGQGLNGQMAIVNNLLVYGIGQDPTPTVRKLIDRVKAGNAEQPVAVEVQAAMKLMPGSDKAPCFLTYNLLRAMQSGMAMMPMPMPQQAVQSQSNMAIAGGAANGRLAIDIAMPKQHLLEIVGMAMQMQGQMQQQMKQP